MNGFHVHYKVCNLIKETLNEGDEYSEFERYLGATLLSAFDSCASLQMPCGIAFVSVNRVQVKQFAFAGRT